MKKILLILMVGIVVLLCGCNETEKTEKLTYNYDESSMIGDFTIKNNEVIIPCSISVTNNTNEELSFTMTGAFEQDEDNPLLKRRSIPAYPEEDKFALFHISPNSTKEYQVLFIGEHAGGTEKMDRLPPEDIIFVTTDKS